MVVPKTRGRGAGRLSLQPWVSRCARDSRHFHGWAHGFAYCLDWPIRDKPPEICGAECATQFSRISSFSSNFTLLGGRFGHTFRISLFFKTIKKTDKIYANDVWIVCIIIKIVMTSRTCNQTRAPSRESGENRGRIETLTAGDWA